VNSHCPVSTTTTTTRDPALFNEAPLSITLPKQSCLSKRLRHGTFPRMWLRSLERCCRRFPSLVIWRRVDWYIETDVGRLHFQCKRSPFTSWFHMTLRTPRLWLHLTTLSLCFYGNDCWFRQWLRTVQPWHIVHGFQRLACDETTKAYQSCCMTNLIFVIGLSFWYV